MSTLRVLVVDDEPLGRKAIRQLLAHHEGIDIVGEARDGKEAVRLIEKLAPDLLFLDVQMPEVDGFAVLRQIDPNRLPMVIFVTAYDTFAVKAFEANALDYLVKPLNEGRFHQALVKATERLRSDEALELSKRLSQLLTGSNDQPGLDNQSKCSERVLVALNGAETILDASEISWIRAEDYYAAIYSHGKCHLVRESLSSLERRLNRLQFVRIHRTVIVNLAEVRRMAFHSEGSAVLVLRDGTELPISRRRRARVARAMKVFAR